MKYKALYRKYRPSNFDDVVGQESIVKTLINALKTEKVGHAYLFTGTRGTGKTTVAKIFAKSVNCLDPEDGLPCGKCEICKNENTDEIADIIEIDAASNNGVDEIREIKDKVNLVPTFCKYKVYIVDEVHMLSIGAFNALLKTLEEPPSHAIFILATTEPQKLPATIISRCQRFDFKKIPIDKIFKRLKYIAKSERIEINDNCLEEISKIADGALRDAIGLLEQVHGYSDEQITIEDIYTLTGRISASKLCELIKDIVDKDVEKLLDFSQDMYENGKDFEKLSESLMDFLMNVLICKKANEYFCKRNINNKEEIIFIEKEISKDSLIYLIRELTFFIEDIKKSSNPNILFDLFLIKTTSTSENIEIKEEKKATIEIQIVNEENEVDEIKKVLVNNTLALAEKEELKKMQETFKKLQTYLIDKKFKNVVSILLDSKISAVSKDHLMLTYKYACTVEEHDKNKKNINKLINDISGKEYVIVAITEDCWNEIRPYYVTLKKNNEKIDILDEVEDPKEENSKNTEPDLIIHSAITEFGEEIIEMEE
jgi:DNA polymerase-3 subunit gamma/tau